MTVEEKRDDVRDYCNSTTCTACCLEDAGWCDKHDFDVCSELDLNEALKIIDDEVKEDVVNHPSHYTQGGMECIDEMQLIFGKLATMYFCLLNAWKYRKRAPFKGKPEEDMKKSDWYLAKYKELKEGANFGVEEDI